MSGSAHSNSHPEYEDVSNNLRQYTGMRFAQMTLFVAITGGLVSIPKDGSPFSWLWVIVGVFGVISGGIFWVLEERAVDYWHHFMRRALELEKELGYRQYTGRPERDYVTATNATRLLHAILIVFWIGLIYVSCLSTVLHYPLSMTSLFNPVAGLPVILSIGVFALLLRQILRYRKTPHNRVF